MALSINQNIAAFNAYRNLSVTQGDLSKSLEKLSSGFRINRAADDAAGLAISEGLRAQVGGLKQASRNAQDGVSVVQTAEGALTESHAILQRMRTLSVQAANDGGLNTDAKKNIQSEIGELKSELTRIADTTQYNGTKLLDGSYAGKFQVGANVGEVITVTVNNGTAGTGLGAVGLGVNTVDVTTAAAGTAPSGADQAITAIDAAIKTVSTVRADLGAKQNRFEHTIKNLNVAVENLSASESRIRDTDMAAEMSKFTRAQILSQAGTSMLAQANQIPQGVLSLLR
ncbi:flagellin [Quadrisphaera sp. DSM 44207]|uniref:flagellin N-terminal helical domain-containing protein n=1 Tax=Quadrisphaera sp. DSM 44207 TaxID=1881057 RepID=UPI000882E2A5|nr:flagellin [Quadrisphaera sp. DSM 44207]SDQ20290.1 flagellin [Quadrisphaera sp. DSM 44207]